jgi:hypothetical protein
VTVSRAKRPRARRVAWLVPAVALILAGCTHDDEDIGRSAAAPGPVDASPGPTPQRPGAQPPDILQRPLGESESADARPEPARKAAPVKMVLDGRLESALQRDLGLSDDEARCLSDGVMDGIPESGEDDPAGLAQEVVAAVRAAQADCFTEERLSALAEKLAAPRKPDDPGRKAFLAAVPAVAPVRGTEENLVTAGHRMCELAEESGGSLQTVVARFNATPAASAQVAANLTPLLGINLRKEELISLATVAVVSLCPESNDIGRGDREPPAPGTVRAEARRP